MLQIYFNSQACCEALYWIRQSIQRSLYPGIYFINDNRLPRLWMQGLIFTFKLLLHCCGCMWTSHHSSPPAGNSTCANAYVIISYFHCQSEQGSRKMQQRLANINLNNLCWVSFGMIVMTNLSVQMHHPLWQAGGQNHPHFISGKWQPAHSALWNHFVKDRKNLVWLLQTLVDFCKQWETSKSHTKTIWNAVASWHSDEHSFNAQ